MRQALPRGTHSAIIPCLKKLILFAGRLQRVRSREAPEEASFARPLERRCQAAQLR